MDVGVAQVHIFIFIIIMNYADAAIKHSLIFLYSHINSNLRFWCRLHDNEIKNLSVSNVHQVCLWKY